MSVSMAISYPHEEDDLMLNLSEEASFDFPAASVSASVSAPSYAPAPSSPLPSSASSSSLPFDAEFDFDFGAKADLLPCIKEEDSLLFSAGSPSSPSSLSSPSSSSSSAFSPLENPPQHLYGDQQFASNSLMFEKLLENLHGQSQLPGEPFLLPMEEEEEDLLSGISSADDELLFDHSTVNFPPAEADSALHFAPQVDPPLPTLSSPSPAAAAFPKKSAPKTAKGRPSPLSVPSSKAAVAAATATSSPPSSPPSSPHSSSSRSPSPSPMIAKSLLSSKPGKVQIGKNIVIEISEEDLVTMEVEQIARIAGTKFTKAEEKDLKRLRRKSRNKVSAAQSRNKKKTYLSGLEDRVDAVTSLNIDLKKRLKELERENSTLKNHVNFLTSHVEPGIRAALPPLPTFEPFASSSEDAMSSSVAASAPTAAAAPAAAPHKDAKPPAGKPGSSSLLTAALDKPSAKASKVNKSTGIYLMLVFLSFGIFFNVVGQNQSAPLIQLPGSLSRNDPAALFQATSSPLVAPQRTFMVRKMHSYDEDDLLMDTIPMLDHLEDPNSTCNDDSFWDAYYDAELASIDFNERYKHEAVFWKNCPDAVQRLEGSHDIVGLEEKLKNIKLGLENQENVDQVVCSTEICLVRLEDSELF